jgi:integrase
MDKFPFSRISLQRVTKHPPPAGERRYFHDTKSNGLTLEFLPSGRTGFQFYAWHLGRPKRIALGRFDPTLPDARRIPEGADPHDLIAARGPLSVAMARALVAACWVALGNGEDPTAQRRAKAAEPTVAEVLNDYDKHITATKRPNSAESVRSTLSHLKSLGSTRITRLTRDDVRRLHARVGQSVGKTIANRCLDTLRAAINRALNGGTIVLPSGNPAAGIERFSETERERFLSPAELALLRRALKYEPLDVQDIIDLLLLTGARKSAMLFSTFKDIDFDRAEWRVPPEHSKSGVAYTIPLVEAALVILRRRRNGAAGRRVFMLSDSGLTRAWGRIVMRCKLLALAEAMNVPVPAGRLHPTLERMVAHARINKLDPAEFGVVDCTLHDLRRTYGSYAAISGASLHLVGKMLGHTSTRATKVYARLSQDAVRAAVQRTTEALSPTAAVADVIPISATPTGR